MSREIVQTDHATTGSERGQDDTGHRTTVKLTIVQGCNHKKRNVVSWNNRLDREQFTKKMFVN